MLNNKGQSLILFIVILPILLLVAILVIDVGRLLVLKHELNNISDIVLDYGLDHLDDESLQLELINIVKLNNSKIDDVDIIINEDKINMKLKENVNGIFSGFIKISVFDVETNYVAYIKNNEKIIERISG